MKKIMQLSLEEDSSGKTNIEDEKVFYARISSFDVLSKADDKEEQEQYLIHVPKSENNLTGGRLRVRATTNSEGVTEYVQTIKIKTPTHENETSFLVTKDVFDQFVLMASSGMKKTRYFYNIPGRKEKWEVDVFKLQEGELKGKTANWCKIDFEFVDPENRDVPPLPEGFLDCIAGDTTDPEDKEFIGSLYEHIFLTKAGNTTEGE